MRRIKIINVCTLLLSDDTKHSNLDNVQIEIKNNEEIPVKLFIPLGIPFGVFSKIIFKITGLFIQSTQFKEYTIYTTILTPYIEVNNDLIENNVNMQLTELDMMEYKSLISLHVKNIQKVSPNLSQFTIIAFNLYSVMKDNINLVNIPLLFNINSVSDDINRIFCQSSVIDNNLCSSNPIEYVKTSNKNLNIFKSIDDRYNTCGFYFGKTIETNQNTVLVLQHINISQCCMITFTFSIISIESYEVITDKLLTWVEKNLQTMMNKVHLNVALQIPIDLNNNSFIITKGRGIWVVETSIKQNLNEITKIFKSTTPLLKFTTKTSTFFSGFKGSGIESLIDLYNEGCTRPFTTVSILKKYNFPNVHIIVNENKVYKITLTNCTIDECNFNLRLTMNILSATQLEQSQTEMSVESIRAFARNKRKDLLKTLLKLDPELFGVRKIGNNFRSYSGLCQKYKQRPTPITKSQYDFLQQICPESIANLENQTYVGQRLYLFCPYTEYPFLNYHHFINQMCIVRCTRIGSNPQQYNYCKKSLKSEDKYVIDNKFESQAIIMYNPLINVGRICEMPEEISYLFSEYVLLKIETDNIDKFILEKYNSRVLIININNGVYKLETDISINNSYVIAFQSNLLKEVNQYLVVVLRNNINKTPTIPLTHPFIKYIKSINSVRDTFIFFDYVLNALKLVYNRKIDINIEENSNSYLLETISNKYNLQYVGKNDIIYGIMINSYYISTPRLRMKTNMLNLFDVLKDKNTKLPNSSIVEKLLILFKINNIYMDYNKLCVYDAFYNNYKLELLCVADNKQTDYKIFDSISYIYYLTSDTKQNMKLKGFKLNSLKVISELLYMHLFIMLREDVEITIKTLKRRLDEYKIITNNETNIIQYNSIVDFINSRINNKELNKILETINITKPGILFAYYNIGNKLCQPYLAENEFLYSKIITV